MRIRQWAGLVMTLLALVGCGSGDPEPNHPPAANAIATAERNSLEPVEGGALFLTRLGVETRRAEFLNPADCQHVANIMNGAEPLARWHCSTSEPDIRLACTISGFELGEEAAQEGFSMPRSLPFRLVLNRGNAWGESEVGVPLMFKYTESDSSFLLTNDYPFASGNYFTSAVYLMVIEKATGAVEIQDIGGRDNGSGVCSPDTN